MGNRPLRPVRNHYGRWLITALHTGFRKPVLRLLTWEEVDGKRRSMTVRAAYA